MEGELNQEKIGDMDSEQETEFLLHPQRKMKGGLRTMPFIIVNEAFEKVASYGLAPNMIFYLTKVYHLEVASGSNILSIWGALSNALAIFGAFVADSYLGRFRVIILGSVSSLLGMILLWLTAMVPNLRPSSCEEFEYSCNSPTAIQLAILFSSFGLMSIGAGCIRPCSIAFGADQFKKKHDPDNERVLDSYFNWYYASIGISTVLALTVIVYIQDHLGWRVGFAVPAALMVCSALMFLLGSSLFIKAKASKSLFTGLVQVLVVAFRNRKARLPPTNCYDRYHRGNATELLAPSENLRCLNKACIIEDPEVDLNPDGSASNPWTLCTVENVESFKSLLRVIPMWSSGIMLFVDLGQTFGTLQANIMDRHITSSFEFPAGSFSLFLIVTLTVWIAFYDRIMVPLLSRYTGQPRGLSPQTRMGIGLVLSCVAMAVSAVVESIRRQVAINEGLVDNPHATVDMSAMWLVPQNMLLGLAEGLNAIGQVEFFYSQFPKSMSSIAVAITTLAMAIASLITGVLVSVVDGVTSKGGNVSWLSSNLNMGHVDYYYWFLTFLNVLNFFYFLVCCRVYTHSEERSRRDNQVGEEEFDSRH